MRLVCFFLFFSFLLDGVVTANSKFIRVALLRDQEQFTMAVDGRYDVLDYATGVALSSGMRMLPNVVSLKKGKIYLGARVYDLSRIIIVPNRGVIISINKRDYRGSIFLINNRGQNMTVVNTIELEQYTRGVLCREISDQWPMDALKAQAVATRTFAVYSMEKFAAHDYDVTNDIYSQVYGGRGAERYRTNVAVARTRGEVLTYNGKIFPTVFHANSGGITEDAAELWDIDILPLKGGVQSPFSIDSPHYRWRRNFRLKDIQDALNARGYHLGLIQEIKVEERNKSGRVKKLRIITRDGKEEMIDGKLFRDIIGPNVLRSNKFDIEMQGWFVDFVGFGWGHGVGLCQWGAYRMSEAHYNYRQILDFYYPSSRLTQLKDVD
ncbi:MAG: SpoIID/LytB domain-containing protein [Candidatus Omnitrophota bacterium]